MANKNILGSWAFLIGVVLAVVAGIFSALEIADLSNNFVSGTLVVLGLIVGLLNISSKETTAFLMSGVSLIIASVFGAGITIALPVVSAILASLLLIFVPATIIVAIRNVFNLAKK